MNTPMLCDMQATEVHVTQGEEGKKKRWLQLVRIEATMDNIEHLYKLGRIGKASRDEAIAKLSSWLRFFKGD